MAVQRRDVTNRNFMLKPTLYLLYPLIINNTAVVEHLALNHGRGPSILTNSLLVYILPPLNHQPTDSAGQEQEQGEHRQWKGGGTGNAEGRKGHGRRPDLIPHRPI
jgi:hypothetical protein